MTLSLILSTLFTLSAPPYPASNLSGDVIREVCEEPIPWELTALDERFGLEREEATDAIRQASILWSDAAGGRLLFRENLPDEEGGVQIRFIFDERQETTLSRRQRERELADASLQIEHSRAELDSVRSELEDYRTRQANANRAYLERMSEYNRLVSSLNQAGGVSPEMNVRLSEMLTVLDEEQVQVVALTEEFNLLVATTNERADALNAEIAAFNADRDAFQRDFSDLSIVPARYFETRRELGPFTTSLTRAIEVYHFEDRYDLILLLAREMGRALGLELSTIPESVMSGTASTEGFPALHSSDIAALRMLCEID